MRNISDRLYILPVLALLLMTGGCAQVEYDPDLGGFVRKEPAARIRRDAILLEKDAEAAAAGRLPGSVAALDWEEEKSSTFLASVSEVLEYSGQAGDYNWLSGVSGAAFRFQFNEGWCPGAADPTVGYGVSPYLFDALGFDYRFMVEEKKGGNRDAMRDAIAESLRKDYPVIAMELAYTAEWGLITGMQKKNKELLCRTFFNTGDTTTYMVADKFPWTILLIEEKRNPPAEKESVIRSIMVAHDMNSIEHVGDYMLGPAGIRAWIDRLDNEYFEEMTGRELELVMLVNARLFRRLRDDRLGSAEYLARIQPLLPKYARKLMELEDLYEGTSRILSRVEEHVPYPWQADGRSGWSRPDRKKQAEALELVLVNETRCAELLAMIARNIE